jgi:hypothetical protein
MNISLQGSYKNDQNKILLLVTLLGGSAGNVLHKIEEGARAVSAIIQRACDDVEPPDEDHFE